MAEAPRSSSRPVKIRMNADYVYDPEAFSGVVRRSAVVFDQQSQSAPADISSFTTGNFDVASHVWSGIDFVSQCINNDEHSNSDQCFNIEQSNNYQMNSDSSSEYQSRCTITPDSSVFEGFVKNGQEELVNKSKLKTLYRKTSSTRYEYIDPEEWKVKRKHYLDPVNCF